MAYNAAYIGFKSNIFLGESIHPHPPIEGGDCSWTYLTMSHPCIIDHTDDEISEIRTGYMRNIAYLCGKPLWVSQSLNRAIHGQKTTHRPSQLCFDHHSVAANSLIPFILFQSGMSWLLDWGKCIFLRWPLCRDDSIGVLTFWLSFLYFLWVCNRPLCFCNI